MIPDKKYTKQVYEHIFKNKNKTIIRTSYIAIKKDKKVIIGPQNERNINTYRVNTISIGKGDPIQLLRKRVNEGNTM